MSHTENILGMLSSTIDQRNGLMITPSWVAKDMVNILPDTVWNSHTTFLDPCCKSGIFLHEIYLKLMETPAMIQDFPDKTERRQHILHNQLFGIALNPMCQLTTARTAYGTIKGENNIKLIDNYITIVKNKDSRFLKEALEKEFGKEMKFDVVIGNPPYQDSNGSGNGGGGTAVYDKFVLMAFELSNQYISFITPARWYTDENKVVKLKNKLLECNNIVELHDYPNTEEVFSGVYIMGGVCHYLINKNYNGTCKVIEHRDAKVIESIRPIKESFSDIFIRNKDAVSILKKVIERSDFSSFYDNIYDYNIFKLRSYERGSVTKDEHNCIKLYYTGNDSKGGGIGYISRDEVLDNNNIIYKHKVFINSVSDNMLAFPYKTLYKGFYGEPGSVCTESYLTIGNIENEDIANNVIKYLQTRFVRILVQQRKTSQLAYKKIYRFVPNQNFSNSSDIDWSQPISNIDQQLYKKYNISQEEIDYIEKTIKPM